MKATCFLPAPKIGGGTGNVRFFSKNYLVLFGVRVRNRKIRYKKCVSVCIRSSCFTVQGCVMRGHLKEEFKEYANKTYFFFYLKKRTALDVVG